MLDPIDEVDKLSLSVLTRMLMPFLFGLGTRTDIRMIKLNEHFREDIKR